MFKQNQILNNTYQILHPIGSGGTSSVYLGYHLRLQKHVVIKRLQGSYNEGFLMRTEVDILKNLHHPHLPQVYDFVQELDHVYTIIDFVDGYDLDAYITSGYRFPEQLLKRYLRQIAEVLDYLHSQNPSVIHSDIKPGNIIINQEGNAILIDFNTSIGGNQGNLLGLTLPYASPEQVQMARYLVYGQTPDYSLDGRSDLYSLGATFYHLISGIQPTPGTPPTPLHTMGISDYSRDFLVLIDRLIDYDPQKRVKSAKKLMAAIDRLDSRYRTYFALRCASFLVSAALIAGGVFCVLRGTVRKSMELYHQQYQTMSTLIRQGQYAQAEALRDGILADQSIQGYLQDSPMDLARLYHAMGDLEYYKDNFPTALSYYRYAVDLCGSAYPQEMGNFIRDAAVAAAQSGDLITAEQYLRVAQERQVDSDNIALIQIVIDARSGNRDACLQQTNRLIGASTSQEVCLRALLAAASTCDSPEDRIYYLQLAAGYDPGRTAARGLAVAYGELAQKAGSQAERQSALTSATAIYEELCASLYASSTDRTNYSVILRMQGKNDQAALVLRTALEYDPENYRIMANLCFLYYEMHDDTQASAYCNRAIQAWRLDNSPGRLTESSQTIQDLLEIGRRYGIGGG